MFGSSSGGGLGKSAYHSIEALTPKKDSKGNFNTSVTNVPYHIDFDEFADDKSSAVSVKSSRSSYSDIESDASLLVLESAIKDRIFANASGLDKPLKTIGYFGSFVLLLNNTMGPAMMGLPQVFQDAGVIPTTVAIVVIGVMSSLTSGFLSNSISLLPGNGNFDQEISFAMAFKLIIGKNWFHFAETMFLISCMVQACASLIETAQSLDGFIASFLIGRTYALEILPQPRIVSWSAASCVFDNGSAGSSAPTVNANNYNVYGRLLAEASLSECTPFHNSGSLVLTLGFVVTTMLFMPFGRGHLKEALMVQIISFVMFFILAGKFMFEFADRIDFDQPDSLNQVQWMGGKYSQLAGIVLFNFAFSLAVPSWLIEKKKAVNASKVIGSNVALSIMIYIAFGLAGALAFKECGSNILVLLSSGKVSRSTNLSAALFSIFMLGSGVPIFCIIIKTTLYNSQTCNAKWSVFFGAVMPYMLSWTLYQGALLTTVMTWTGLSVNGLVAFILPLVLAHYAFSNYISSRASSRSNSFSYSSSTPLTTGSSRGLYYQAVSSDKNNITFSMPLDEPRLHDDGDSNRDTRVLPDCLEPHKLMIIRLIILAFSLIVLSTIALDMIEGINPEAWDAYRSSSPSH